MTDLGEYTVVVTETPLIGPEGQVESWLPVHWEIRNSAMGEQLIDSYRMNTMAPWVTWVGHAEEVPVTKMLLEEAGIPGALLNRLTHHGITIPEL